MTYYVDKGQLVTDSLLYCMEKFIGCYISMYIFPIKSTPQLQYVYTGQLMTDFTLLRFLLY